MSEYEPWGHDAAPASTGREDIGWKMANWLFGLSVSELMPDSWRKTCADLSAAWHAASPVAARELDVEADRLTDALILEIYRRTFPAGPYIFTNDAAKFARAIEVEVSARFRAEGGNTKPEAGAGFGAKSAETRMDTGFDASAGFAPVSTEQAGDAREQVQHVTWMVGRRVGRTHALAQQIIDNLSDEAKARTSYGNIRDVLDTMHKMSRAPSPVGADSGKDQ